MNHTQRWFLRRISKRIYRDKTSCPCEVCTRGFENGLIVHDKQHAIYLFDCQFCDEVLNYRDKQLSNSMNKELKNNIGEELYNKLSTEQKEFIISVSGTIDLGKNVDIDYIYKKL